ncbi:hypothetical protein RSW84_26680, partial [Escherichia coli]|uniref:hypothetical protein n=2 Tax=Gammaproteobacteria TaxID=1236 RepID=UPI0028DF044E
MRWEVNEQGVPTANFQTLRTSRSLTVAKGITVVVKSPSLKTSKSVTGYYPSKPKTTQAGKAS